MSYHTAYPYWDSLAVVFHLFLYLFICGPTTTFTLLSKFCTSQLSSIFYLSQEPLSCRVSFLKGTYNLQLFKKAIYKGACTLKCIEKRFIPFASLICPPHRIQGKPCIRPHECTVPYTFQKLSVCQTSLPLYSIHPSQGKGLHGRVQVATVYLANPVREWATLLDGTP